MADGEVRVPTVKGPGTTPAYALDRMGNLITSSLVQNWLLEGKVFCSSDGDENDVSAASATSYAATTPTFLLDVKAGALVVPLWVTLIQDGTVAGGDIDVILSYDNIARFSSGGVSETVQAYHTGAPVPPTSLLHSGATATAAGAARVIHAGQTHAFDDVVVSAEAQAKASVQLLAFRDFIPPVLEGAAAFMVFTFAAATGVQWRWSIGWAELPDGVQA